MNCDISWMIGQGIEVTAHDEFQNWWFDFTNGGKLHAATTWRLVGEDRIKRTNADDGQWFGLGAPVDAEAELRSLLFGRKIATAEIRKDTHDFVICFESGERLEIIPTSSGYESWHITTPSGEEIHAQGGGNLIPTILHE